MMELMELMELLELLEHDGAADGVANGAADGAGRADRTVGPDRPDGAVLMEQSC